MLTIQNPLHLEKSVRGSCVLAVDKQLPSKHTTHMENMINAVAAIVYSDWVLWPLGVTTWLIAFCIVMYLYLDHNRIELSDIWDMNLRDSAQLVGAAMLSSFIACVFTAVAIFFSPLVIVFGMLLGVLRGGSAWRKWRRRHQEFADKLAR